METRRKRKKKKKKRSFLCSAANRTSITTPTSPSRFRDHLGRGNRKIVIAKGQGGS